MNQDAHSTGYFDFVVDATPLRVVVCFIREPVALTLDVDASSLQVDLHLGRFFRLGFVV